MLVEVVVLFIVFGIFLATVSCALVTGQARNRRQIRKVHAELNRLAFEQMSEEELEALDQRRRSIEAENRRVMAEFEYGGC